MTPYDNVTKLHVIRSSSGSASVADVLRRVSSLTEGQLALVALFIQQILTCYDPDVVESFVELHQDPKLGSILNIASDLGDEERDQLLFMAEEMFHQQALLSGANRQGTA